MADINKLGRALSGFSAGVSGRLPEFQAGLAAEATREQQMDEKRRQEQLMANRVLLGDLQAGNVDRAVTGLNTRLMTLTEEGANTDFTSGMKGLLETGAPEGIQEAIRIAQAADQEAVTRGLLGPLPAPEKPEEFTLKPGERRFRGPEMIAEVPVTPEVEPEIKAPEALLVGLPQETRDRAEAAFVAAGGGSQGVDALGEQIAMGKQAKRRADVPQLLDASFPNASVAERAQLDAAVAGADDVETGIKIAGEIRAEQRRLKKAKGFQQRAVDLLTGIVDHPELNDVTGTIEGRIDFRAFDQQEADLIADINETQNILTAENMDLMTGVLSESDILLLKNLSSGALNRTRGLSRFMKDATTLRDKLSSQLVETVDDLTGQEPTISTQAEFDALPSGSFFIQDGERRQKP